MKSASNGVIKCPACGRTDVRLSYPNGLRDSLMAAFQLTPLRCRVCQRRFYRRLPAQPAGADVGQDAAPKPNPPVPLR